jgi:hypothetical protein
MQNSTIVSEKHGIISHMVMIDFTMCTTIVAGVLLLINIQSAGMHGCGKM